MKNGSLAVYVKITASHHFDDLRLFHLFRIGSAPRLTSCPYGTEPFAAGVFDLPLPYGVRPSQTALSAGEPLRPGFMTISPLPMAFTGQTRAQRWQPTHLL